MNIYRIIFLILNFVFFADLFLNESKFYNIQTLNYENKQQSNFIYSLQIIQLQPCKLEIQNYLSQKF
ncbi:hypothetical protein pb186bvf_009204 [Paramecium bursaria]